jgi:hypothetical protein
MGHVFSCVRNWSSIEQIIEIFHKNVLSVILGSLNHLNLNMVVPDLVLKLFALFTDKDLNLCSSSFELTLIPDFIEQK